MRDEIKPVRQLPQCPGVQEGFLLLCMECLPLLSLPPTGPLLPGCPPFSHLHSSNTTTSGKGHFCSLCRKPCLNLPFPPPYPQYILVPCYLNLVFKQLTSVRLKSPWGQGWICLQQEQREELRQTH